MIVEIEEAEDGTLVLPLDQSILKELGWQENDTLIWEIEENGTVILRKKDES